jgi:hypothetical protein
MNDPFAPVAGASASTGRKAETTAEWRCVTPVPDDAPEPPRAHPKLGAPSARWTYLDATGRVLGFATRFEEADGGKAFRPLTLWRSTASKRLSWRQEAWPAPRPVYGLDRLAARPTAPVVVTEGEKAADAATRLLSAWVVITSPNGSKSAAKADWSALRGHSVVVWPDADEAGAAYARDVVRLASEAGATSVAVCEPPVGAAAGWDAADAEAEGWTPEQAAAFVQTAKPATAPKAGRPAKTGDGEAPERVRRPAQRDALMALMNRLDLWRDDAGEAFATIPVAGHYENHRVKAVSFRRWIAAEAYKLEGHAPGGQAVDDALRVFEAVAYEGARRSPALRVGTFDGRAYVDLVDDAWRAVEISPDGWRVVDRPAMPFVRTAQMRPLPEPEGGYGVDELRRFVGVESDDDFILMATWLVTALRSSGPYPLVALSGEQGTGKSTVSRLLRNLVDPNIAPIRAAPRDDRDLIVAAVNSHVLALDNLSAVPHWLADALCRLATGGGFASRTLHSNSEETVLAATRPIILNGIPALTERPDLASRALTIRLRRIDESERRDEADFWADWEVVRPRVFGALLDGLAAGLRNFAGTKLARAPRMADFARFSVAAEVGLGFEPGTFMAAYDANIANASDSTFEADPVATAIRDLVVTAHPTGWHGTASELLAALSLRVSEAIRRAKIWPVTASALGNRIERVAPLLRSQGFLVERKHSGVRTISIVPRAPS